MIRILAILVAAVSVLLALATTGVGEGDGAEGLRITRKLYHLGDSKKPGWKEFTTEDPFAQRRLELEFDLPSHERVRALELTAGDVGDDWRVELNGRDLGRLEKKPERTVNLFEVPTAVLTAERNRLVVERERGTDDVFVGELTLHDASPWMVRGLARVVARVVDARSGESLPARLTVVELGEKDVENLADLHVDRGARVAVRKGILYTLETETMFYVEPGKRYRVYAGRGFEYSIDRRELQAEKGRSYPLGLSIEREVDTTGFVAADTHVHTLTHSGHGDATVEERVVTIAGEGVEVAVATDHNHHTDYRPVIDALKAGGRYHPLTGNEFTTDLGHFSGFPIDPASTPADHKIKDWEKLLAAFRATPGLRVVICNHPRRDGFAKGPFGKLGLDPVSGELPREPMRLGLDAVEVVNGKTLESDKMVTFQDWFTLLNRGYRLTAVAASDSHTVGGIVGQARSYVRSSIDDPTQLRIDEIVDSFLGGRVLVSLGLLVDVRVNDRYGVGDLVSDMGDTLTVDASIRGPRWSHVSKVTLYLNGQAIREEALEAPAGEPIDLRRAWTIPRPPSDAHLVVIAEGPPITAPYWPLETKDRYTLGATNPVWLDVDGDAQFSSAYDYARRLVREHGIDAERLGEALEGYDAIVSVQVLSVVRERLEREIEAEVSRRLENAKKGLAAVRQSIRGDGAPKGVPAAIDAYEKSAGKLEESLRDRLKTVGGGE